LYTFEQQALLFIADAQTMQNGVCSQSITRHATGYGYNVRAIQYGIHGRRRNGKLEFPGLLARKIVFLVGGYPHGGKAPGGPGLTPAYAVDLDVLLTFIPEADYDSSEPPEKGEPLGEPSPEKGEPLGAPVHTSSLSSSLSDIAIAAGPVPEATNYSNLAVQANQAAQTNAAAQSHAPTSLSHPKGQHLGVDDGANAFFPMGKKKNAKQEHSDAEIGAELERVFEHVRAQDGKVCAARAALRIDRELYDETKLDSDAVLRPSKKRQTEIADWCRGRGTEPILKLWEEFLVTVDHTLDSTSGEQRSHYLADFLSWMERKFRREHGAFAETCASGGQS
jgi:hypothetical protein